MDDQEFYDLCTKVMGKGELAISFWEDTPVWDEQAVRVALKELAEQLATRESPKEK